MIDGQFLVVASDTFEGCVESRLSLFTFVVVGGIVIVVVIEVVVEIVVVGFVARIEFKCRVIVHLGIDSFDELRDGQFDELRLQQLLLRDALRKLLHL